MKNSMSRFFVTQVHGSRVHGSRLAILGEVREAPPFKAGSGNDSPDAFGRKIPPNPSLLN